MKSMEAFESERTLGGGVESGGVLETVETVVRERRTVKQFLPMAVPRELLSRLIEAAVWAPNHRLTEPWRFYVLDGDSRARLGEVAAEVMRSKALATGGTPEAAERKAREAAAAWAVVPALVYVTSLTHPDPEVDLENYGAVCCAVQNFSLVAHVAGLGTSWSSGAVAAATELRELAGAGPDERMVGLIRVGYPDPAAPPAPARRTPGATYVRWLDG